MPSQSDHPWHLWPVGLLALLWHAAGALEYVLLRFDTLDFTSQVPADWAQLIATQPAWLAALWAVVVWAGLLGAVLLLMAERGAVLVFAAAFIAAVGAVLGQVLVSGMAVPDVAGVAGGFVLAGVIVVQMLLWLYARWLKTAAALD